MFDLKAKTANALWTYGVAQPEQMVLGLKESAEVGYKAFESVKQAIYCYDFDVARFKEVCDQYGVKPISFYFHMSGDWKADCATLPKELKFVRELGIDFCALQAGPNPDRKVDVERTKAATEEIREYAHIAKASGLTFCLHPHINTECEFEPEIDYMMEHLHEDEISMQPDTAHLMAGNCDPVAIFKRYAPRIATVHLKDFAAGSQIETREQEKVGVDVFKCFTELGTGDVDFRQVFDILKGVNFSGYLISELDTPHYTLKESAQMNYDFIMKNW